MFSGHDYQEEAMTAFTEGKHSAITEVDQICDRLRALAAWLNQRSAWDAALKTQMALVQAAEILGAGDADLEESYP
jgi:hypothetical protein